MYLVLTQVISNRCPVISTESRYARLRVVGVVAIVEPPFKWDRVKGDLRRVRRVFLETPTTIDHRDHIREAQLTQTNLPDRGSKQQPLVQSLSKLHDRSSPVIMSEDEIKSFFSPNKPLEPDVLSELQSTMRLHGLSAEDLFFKWESRCIKMGLETEALSLAEVRNLKQGIQDTLEKSNQRHQVQVKTERRVQQTPRAGGGGGDVFGMLDGLVPSTPASAGGKLGKVGSGIKRKMETPVAMSSPAGGVSEQLKSMNGVP